ncbi:TlpA disulfide reductase family protein [Pedobacter nutrimenti]|uniref:TlpA family protein disulfide reductase n=1 Tax=Pedobacter nutrimenti TaxID=1241337 RepID=UPI00293168DC|nr:TlpA disulfide reductase family protein [Pedobacter nutrimenti]
MLTRFISISIVLFFSLLCYNFTDGNGKPDPKIKQITPHTTISVRLSEKEQLILNYKQNYGTYVSFKNLSSSDTTVKRSFLLTAPTLFHYIIDPITNNFRTLLILPGDSILLSDNGKKVLFSTSYPDYIEDILDVPPLFYQFNPKLIQELNVKGAISASISIEKRFEENNQKINDAKLSDGLKTILNDLNNTIKYQLCSYIDQRNLTLNETTLLDSLDNEMAKNAQKIGSINTTLTETIYKHLIEWSYNKKNKRPISDFWSEVNNIDTSVANAPYYYDYLITWAQSYFLYDYKELGIIDAKLKRIPNPNPAIKRVISLSDILLQTTVNFRQAKQDLTNFEGGKYLYLFENENVANHETRNIKQIETVTLFDIEQRKTVFQKVFNDRALLYFVDFWASWCKPCIEDYPYLKKAQDQLKKESIKFISISIDDKGSRKTWLKTLEKLGAHKHANQFMLENAKESPLTHFFRINRIPRYIVIDHTGNILNEDFFGPSDPRFRMELMKLLNIP